MNLYYQNSLIHVELSIMFSDCSVKFDTIQNISNNSPVAFLMFQKFMNIKNYDRINIFNLPSKCCGFLYLPESCKLTDIQQTASTTFSFNLMSSDLIVAETTDDKNQFIYLIRRKNIDSPLEIYFGQMPFEMFQLTYEELWNLQYSMISYMKTLLSNTILLSKQILEYKNNICYYKQFIND